ncbi:hypothetical protein NDU88_000497 [Pleurodeles waltl]|uniref:Uncharacterized protein n=1 Tax=Pleurodeles waltl TaxID=8319 RepID=A0AAV7N9S9_PLEWA|nr:hypothetical protein NDU88_000497 [Pleurodeles waltl]
MLGTLRGERPDQLGAARSERFHILSTQRGENPDHPGTTRSEHPHMLSTHRGESPDHPGAARSERLHMLRAHRGESPDHPGAARSERLHMLRAHRGESPDYLSTDRSKSPDILRTDQEGPKMLTTDKESLHMLTRGMAAVPSLTSSIVKEETEECLVIQDCQTQQSIDNLIAHRSRTRRKNIMDDLLKQDAEENTMDDFLNQDAGDMTLMDTGASLFHPVPMDTAGNVTNNISTNEETQEFYVEQARTAASLPKHPVLSLTRTMCRTLDAIAEARNTSCKISRCSNCSFRGTGLIFKAINSRRGVIEEVVVDSIGHQAYKLDSWNCSAIITKVGGAQPG